jgi:Protein of unknown function C-terminus (DUF2399)
VTGGLDLTPRASRLAELIEGRGRGRTRLDELWELLDRADPASRLSVDRRTLLAAAVEELVTAGVITRSAGEDRGRPPLPKHVDRVRVVGSAPPPARPQPWHPELAWAARRRLTGAQEELLRAVNRWLFDGGTRAPEAPLRERAWEITGDEKAFDRGLVADGSLTPAVLRAERVVLPLHTERVGGGPVCLVVENADTFDSLCRALTASPGDVGRVAWGAGGAFGASVLSLLADPPGAIRYFGDLDPAGLRIPAAASVLAQEHGLPPVRPATGLYAALLERGLARARRGARTVAGDGPDDLVAWLDPEHRERARAVLAAGDRLAQEALGRAWLAGSDEWRAGLG